MAKVRLDSSTSRRKRKERVDAVLRDLGLIKCQNTLIGVPGRIKVLSKAVKS